MVFLFKGIFQFNLFPDVVQSFHISQADAVRNVITFFGILFDKLVHLIDFIVVSNGFPGIFVTDFFMRCCERSISGFPKMRKINSSFGAVYMGIMCGGILC